MQRQREFRVVLLCRKKTFHFHFRDFVNNSPSRRLSLFRRTRFNFYIYSDTTVKTIKHILSEKWHCSSLVPSARFQFRNLTCSKFFYFGIRHSNILIMNYRNGTVTKQKDISFYSHPIFFANRFKAIRKRLKLGLTAVTNQGISKMFGHII